MCAITGTQAIPAFPRPVKITIGSDSFYLYLKGDEGCKYAITEDGYTAFQTSDGWYYAMQDINGDVVVSPYKVCSEWNKDFSTKSFLNSLPKGLHVTSSDEITSFNISHNPIGVQKKQEVKGNIKVLIILMQFSDVRFTKTQNDFQRLFNEKNYKEDGAYGSVYDYYDKVSYSQLQLHSDVLGPFTASHNMAYYGGNSSRSRGDMNPKALFDEAIQYATKKTDLSMYDSDLDGYIDNIHIIFAGYGEEAGASSNAIWSHEMTFRTETIDGMKIDHYSCSPELRGNNGEGISRIGPPCHEIGHALGAMDYYDVDYQTGGYYEGTGDWDIMASGSWNDDGARPADFNPYVKAYNFGWVDVQCLNLASQNTIMPSTNINNIYRIDTPVSGDFFLLDNRQSTDITGAEPGKGLLIFHIGPQLSQKAQSNTINATYPQQCYIVCASAREAFPKASPSSYGSISSAGCPYPGTTNNTSFTDKSTPAALCFNGHNAGFSITNIQQMNDGSISLFFSEQSGGEEPNPDDNEDDLNEYNGQVIWSDDFEIRNKDFSHSWIQEELDKDVVWTVKNYSDAITEKEPSVASGRKYMAMEVTNSSGIMGSGSRYRSRIWSNQINVQPGDYVLSGKYAAYTSGKLSNDSLCIDIKSTKKLASKTIIIQRTISWQTFNMPFHIDKEENIQISFTGTVNEKDIMFLDNLILLKPEPTFIEEKQDETDTKTLVYNLNGTLMGYYEKIKPILKPGIYILRDNQSSYKIIVK